MMMSKNFRQSDLAEIKNRVLVSDVVGRRVKLVKRGRDWFGLSPFKQERTPSFTVNDDKQFYHCFSTGKHGTIFDFLMETEGMTFRQAVEVLSKTAGLKAGEGLSNVSPAEAKPRNSKKSEAKNERRRRTAYNIYRKAAPISPDNLAGQYLIKRGFTIEEIAKFATLPIRFGARTYYDGQFENGKLKNAIYHPALIAAATGSNGRFAGCQRTYLSPKAEKIIAVDTDGRPLPSRKTIGRLAGGAVRLGKIDTDQDLYICEGLEDALALRVIFGMCAAWATLGTSNLRNLALPSPAELNAIVIFYDQDEAGLSAANTLKDNAEKDGHNVVLRAVPDGNSDPNDWLINQRNSAK